MPADSPTRPFASIVLAAVACFACLAYLLTTPQGWTTQTPLLWDQAGHYAGASDLAVGIEQRDLERIDRALLGADQYPPMHSIVLGLWMVLTGAGVQSWLALGLVIYVATALLLARVHPVAALLFLTSAAFGSIAPSLMVEPLAILLLTGALLSAPDPVRAGARVSYRRTAVFGLLALLAILTKYNVGLPLLPAALIASAWIRDLRASVAMLVTVLLVLAAWAIFLTAQTLGWEMFADFAENRSNSAEESPFARLVWYWHTFRRDFVPGSVVAVLTLAVGGGGAIFALSRRWTRGGGRLLAGFTTPGRLHLCDRVPRRPLQPRVPARAFAARACARTVHRDGMGDVHVEAHAFAQRDSTLLRVGTGGLAERAPATE